MKALWRRLGYRKGIVAHLDEVPDDYRTMLRGLPHDVRLDGTLDDSPRLIHHFTTDVEGLRARLAIFLDAMPKTGMIWVSYPKATSGVDTSVRRDSILSAAAPLGLVDAKVCSIDATWTAIKLVVRKEEA